VKGLIFDIKHYSINDGPGIRTTVFFKGCPLRCWWCHNPESQSGLQEFIMKERSLDGKSYRNEEVSGRWYPVEEVMNEIEKDRIYYDESNGGVTFSGGEPLVQHKFLSVLLKLMKEKGIHTALDTCGQVEPAVLEEVMDKVDLFLYDLKLLESDAHKKYTGVHNEMIISNLRFLVGKGKQIIIRFPVIPGITDTAGNIAELKDFLSGMPSLDRIDLLPYHRIAKHKYSRMNMEYKLSELEEPSVGHLSELKSIFESLGMKVSIGG
jgi:pyruvate formate lyase activating enzyme